MDNKLRYNLHGYLIEYNTTNRLWTWNKWDYEVENGRKKVVRRSGNLQFQKMFRSVFEGGRERFKVRKYNDIEKALKKRGVDYIFLFLGATNIEEQFSTIEEAHKYHQLNACPQWDLTDYWFGYDRNNNTWAMYDAFTGALQFTPQKRMDQQTRNIKTITAQKFFMVGDCFYRDAGETVH